MMEYVDGPPWLSFLGQPMVCLNLFVGIAQEYGGMVVWYHPFWCHVVASPLHRSENVKANFGLKIGDGAQLVIGLTGRRVMRPTWPTTTIRMYYTLRIETI